VGAIRLTATEAAWFADIEAQGSEHLRVRLRPAERGPMPAWAEGTTLECAMDGSDGLYSAEAVVLKQAGAYLWLRVPPVWVRGERRQHPRVQGGFPVRYKAKGIEGIGVCQNISVGGLRLRVGKAIPERTRLELRFSLPGETATLRLEGLVLRVSPIQDGATGYDIGIKLIGLSPSDSACLFRYMGTTRDE